MSKRVVLIFFLFVLAVLWAGAYVWVYGNPLSAASRLHPALPCPTTPNLTFLEPQRFSFAMQGPGRQANGDYVDASGKVVEAGFNSRDDLARHLLTYAEGHPQGNALQGRSWKDHVNRTEYQRICTTQAGDKVLVVQSGQKCVLVDADLQVAGLVVRTGGVLLVAGAVTLKSSFLLVESGGLLQAGSRYAESHRYDDDSKFTILLTNGPSSYEDMVDVASQYGSAVYAPGITEANADEFSDFTGSLSHHLSNHFGKKAVCVGFNGNLHLAGAIGPEVDYRGTWDATDVSDPSRPPWFGPEERLSVGSPVFRKTYPVTWVRLVGKASKGAAELTIDLRDAPAGSLENWRVDSQILITGCPDQYFTKSNPLGLLPLWVDNDAGPQRAANQKANDGFGLSYASGNEVQKIASIDPNTGTIRLRSPLLFDHDASPSAPIQRPDGRSVEVDQPLHVCLLTRNILVTSVLEAGRSGCNVRHTGDDVHAAGIVCNQYGTLGGDVSTCYKDLGAASPYCGSQAFPGADSVAGHWIFGSDGLKGCGAIHGGQCIFRYGSAVHFDAVELKYMGTPANFGSIAQYALHFHMSGYAQSFRDYLPSRDHPREANVHNCSIWLALSRWVTLHGTMQASISNNIGFYCLGSGYFIEDGTELLNVFEHNVGCYALPGVQNNYYNPVPIMPNVASDFGPMATFWMKNNFNYMARNVACSSPAPAIGFWLVPQPISGLRGPSTLLLGSEVLGLPGVASMGNAAGPNGLSDKKNTNTNGAVVRFSGNTACWVPADFDFPLTSRLTLCNAYNTDNANIPLLGFMENVCYGMYMFLSVTPEQISAGPVTTVPCSELNYACTSPSTTGCGSIIFGIGWQSQDNRARAQWMPANGQNSCTDRIVSAYPEPAWDPDLPKQPFDQPTQDRLKASCHTQSQTQSFRLIPFIISGCLGFGFSSFDGQAGGAMWFHQCPAWLINCALLQKSLAPAQSMPKQSCGSSTLRETNAPAETQTFVSQTSSENADAYSSVYPVFFNFLTNGAFDNPANPTLFTGDLSCFPKEDWGWGSTHQECNNCLANYFVDFGVPIKNILPQKLRWSDSFVPEEDMAIFDLRTHLSYKYDSGSGAFGPSSMPFPKAASPSEKYPYICGLTGLYTDATGDITANFVTAHFLTPQAQRTGGLICASLANVPPCYGKNGAPPFQAQGWPASCAKLFCQ
jgi:hypothetical protein